MSYDTTRRLRDALPGAEGADADDSGGASRSVPAPATREGHSAPATARAARKAVAPAAAPEAGAGSVSGRGEPVALR